MNTEKTMKDVTYTVRRSNITGSEEEWGKMGRSSI